VERSLSPPRVIGHRGAAAHAPENTLAGFRAARALGALWVEFDVQATRDDRAILLHDARLERTTDGRGIAADRSAGEIAGLDAGAWFAKSFRGEKVPTLEAALALLDEMGLGAVIEVKAAPGDGPRTMRAALAVLRQCAPSEARILSSFDEAALGIAAAEAPAVPRALIVKSVPADWRLRLQRLGASALHAGERGLDQATVRAVAAAVPLRAYTVNAPDRARTLISWGAAAVFTDRPDVIISALNHHSEPSASARLVGE
jgi:glycerophosphoryl diester phosphodiesterase